MGEGKYLNLWKGELSFILSAIEKGGAEKKLSSEEFQHSGNREVSGYTFRLDISNGNVPEKSNTAVARDLKKTLDDSRKFREIAQNKKITIRMGVEFILIVRVHEL